MKTIVCLLSLTVAAPAVAQTSVRVGVGPAPTYAAPVTGGYWMAPYYPYAVGYGPTYPVRPSCRTCPRPIIVVAPPPPQPASSHDRYAELPASTKAELKALADDVARLRDAWKAATEANKARTYAAYREARERLNEARAEAAKQ